MFKAVINKPILWILTALITIVVSLGCLFSRRRMSHENGVVATGRIRILDDLNIPPSNFFRPGREFSCRLRHATVSFEDDARLAARGASLKFSDTGYDAPLDLKMNTGEAGPFANASDFLRFMIATIRGRETHIKPYLDKNPLLVEGIRGAVCYPDTFTELNYFSKTPYLYADTAGNDWYVKFKLAPKDRGKDRGRPTDKELEEFWLQKTRPGESRPKNFLKDELRTRIKKGPVTYLLMAQFRAVEAGEDRNVLNCAMPWDENEYPWLDLATVEIDRVLPLHEGNMTWYDLHNTPECMSVPVARSINDPASVNYLRMHDIWAKRARLLSYRLRGQLPPNPDHRRGSSQKLATICLPQNEPAESVELRRDELISERQIYELAPHDGLPPYVRVVPRDHRFTASDKLQMIKDVWRSIKNKILSAFHTMFRRRTSLAFFDRYYQTSNPPPVKYRFLSDLEFGRQRLNGVNPILIKRCDRIPDNLPVNDDIVHGLLDEKESLQSAIAAGKLYILDHKALTGIEVKNGYLAVPISLFYCNKLGQLLPIAIQLSQTPGHDAPIFTPKDAHWLWSTVKTHVQSADATYHEVASHLLRTHLVMEAVAVTCHRQLHDRHPVFQLLEPHFHNTMAINHGARTSMLAPNGPIDKVLGPGAAGSIKMLKREYAKWDFAFTDLPLDLRNRGVADRDALPHYYYRDDGLLVWNAIDEYVSRFVARWYPDDGAVVDDFELQAWATEVVHPDAGAVGGFAQDGDISTREHLQEILTRIIWTTTGEHTSVNAGQYEMFGYPPNVPGSMYKPWPVDKEDALSEQDFVSRLPNHAKCAEQMQMVHLLSKPTPFRLGDFTRPYFHGMPEMWEEVSRFRQSLDAISATIEKRNDALEVPYTYLHPANIGESISI